MAFNEKLAHMLDERRIATLTTYGSDDMPHVTAVWYLWEDDALYIATSLKTGKGRNLQRDPRMALCIESREAGRESGMTAVGRAELITGDEAAPLSRRINGKYLTPAALADQPFEEIITHQGKYRPYRELGFSSWYPIIQGYRDEIALGANVQWQDPVGLHRFQVDTSYSWNTPSDESVHFSAEYQALNWWARSTISGRSANATARITPQTIKSAKGARIRAALKSRKAIMTKRTMPSMIQPESLPSSAIACHILTTS